MSVKLATADLLKIKVMTKDDFGIKVVTYNFSP